MATPFSESVWLPETIYPVKNPHVQCIPCYKIMCRVCGRLYAQRVCTSLCTSIKIIKNEVGCRDDTMPKTGDTRRHCEVELTVCNNLPQPPKKRDVGRGVAEDCCILSTLPRSAFLCHLFLTWCHPYILLHF